MPEGVSHPAAPLAGPAEAVAVEDPHPELYRLLAENISDIIIRADLEGALVYVSPTCRLWGYEPEELIGRPSTDFVHPDDRERLLANTAQVLQGRRPDDDVDRTIRYRRKDGRWVWLEGNPRALRDEAGRVSGLINVFRDVTARKRAEAAALAAEAERQANVQLFENAFHHAPIGMALVGLDGRLLKINAALRALTGYSEPKLLSLDFQAITYPEDLDADLDLLRRLTRGEIPSYQMDKRYVRADGAVVWARLSVSMVVDGDGRPKHYVGQVQDLTAAHNARRALTESERRFRRLADNAPDMVTESRLDGVLTYVSPASEAITGFTPDELLGRTAFAFMQPEDAERMRAMCQTVRASNGAVAPWPIQFRATHKDGRPLWLESKPAFAVDPETGRFTGLNDVIRDVTAQKTLETELRRAQAEAEAAAAAKGEFLANMSHEIRTPLTAILGFAGLLAERDEMDDIGRGHLRRVLSASRSLLSIVNDILDFSKLEAASLELSPRPTPLVEFAHEVLLMFAPDADAKGLTLDFIAESATPDHVALDPDRFRQVLFNLIGNAIKFTPNGTVRLRLDYDRKTGRLKVAVRDSGPGLSPADQAKLFQRFAQVDGSSTRQHGGTGLGLAICKGLVEAMGGEIGLESELGRGATFWFEIPTPIADAPMAAAQSEFSPSSLDGARVLVIDDNRANRELARAVLEHAGTEVTLASGGAEGADLAAVTPLDLILLDRRMPGLDGVQTLKLIRAAPGPNDGIPILAFSADTDLDTLLGEGGFDGVVSKPIDVSVLIETVAAWIQWGAPVARLERDDAAVV
ncbi:MAG TPA: PAS domain S-box protein [Caulobacteraceae bacterium]|nr:PAS domain S-box protein [Caulobacteraceae bacterium]